MSAVVSSGVVNSVLWFTSLRPSEQGVTNRILDDLLPYLDGVSIHHQVFQVATAAQFLQTLDAVVPRIRPDGIMPILHFDMHGSAERGLLIAASDEYVSWDEVADHLRAINVASGNNLFVVSCACCSLQVAMRATIERACPYYALTAPAADITAGMLETTLVPFYRDVFDRSDFVGACMTHLKPLFSLFHSEALLFLALVKYVRQLCVGVGRDRRRENLMTAAVQAGLPPGRTIRQQIRSRTEANQALVDRFTQIFLMGKPPGFAIANVLIQVRKLIEREKP